MRTFGREGLLTEGAYIACRESFYNHKSKCSVIVTNVFIQFNIIMYIMKESKLSSIINYQNLSVD